MTNRPNSTVRMVIAACAFLMGGYTACCAESLRMGGTGAGLELLQIIGKAYATTSPGVDLQIVPSLGTSGGIRALADGALDVAVTSRPLKPDEKSRGLHEIAKARTPFVFVTSRSRPETLQPIEVVAVFGGDTAAWPDKTPIRIVLRPETESDTRLLGQYFPGMSEALARTRLRPEIPVAATDQDNAIAAEETEGSLTSASLVQILTEKRNLRIISINGIAPTLENLKSGRYPYEKSLHFIVSDTSKLSTTGFATFLQSDAAAAIMREAGILPVGQ